MHALLYRSAARPGLLADDLNAIIETAEENNREADVTGLLLHGQFEALPTLAGQFVQWIEGDEGDVEGLFAQIQADRRHSDIEVLARGPIAHLARRVTLTRRLVGGRLFPSWTMGLIRLAELPATLEGFLGFANGWDERQVRTAA